MSRRLRYLRKNKKINYGKRYLPRFFGKKKVPKPSRTYYLKLAKKRQRIILGCLATLVLAGLVYFFGYSPVFQIKEIIIGREENVYSDISDEDLVRFIEPFLSTRRWLIFSQKNVLFFDQKIVEQIIRKNLIVNRLKVYRQFRKLKIQIEEKVPKAALLNNGNYYYISFDGVATQKVLENKLDKNLPLVHDGMAKPAEIRGERLNEPTVYFVTEFFGRFSRKFNAELKILFFEISDLSDSDITAEISEGWKIYLDKTKDINEQFTNLQLVLNEKIKEQRPNLEYIDLRLGNRVFYKLKGIAN